MTLRFAAKWQIGVWWAVSWCRNQTTWLRFAATGVEISIDNFEFLISSVGFSAQRLARGAARRDGKMKFCPECNNILFPKYAWDDPGLDRNAVFGGRF